MAFVQLPPEVLRTGHPAPVSVRDATGHLLLAKGVMVDLHPKAFGPGDTAVTLVAHVGAQITCIDAAPVYQLMVPRSFCLSFWDWLISSGEEYGIALRAKAGTRKD